MTLGARGSVESGAGAERMNQRRWTSRAGESRAGVNQRRGMIDRVKEWVGCSGVKGVESAPLGGGSRSGGAGIESRASVD